ncbi:MAG: OmpA family protein [Bacteroidota bacterium]
MKRFLFALVFLASLLTGWAQEIHIDTIYFRFDSYDLADEDKVRLDSMASKMLQYPSYYVEIFGHTDSIGTTSYNLDLSESRARAIALYLREKGAALDRITYEGMGTTQSIGSNLTYAGRRKNRRADIAAIFSSEVYQPVVKVDSSLLQPKEPEVVVIDPATLTDTIRCEYDFFDINPKRRTYVITPQNTRLIIPPDAFKTENDIIQVRMGEIYQRRDMIAAGMPTLAKDGPLETSGMFSFEARDGRRVAKIKDEVTFEAVVPSTRRDRDMVVYSGPGSRRPKKPKGSSLALPAMPAVKVWRPTKSPVRYNGLKKGYVIEVEKPGNYSISRPLYYALNAERDDQGVDFEVKFKGKRYPKTTTAMLVGEVVKTYIPLRKADTRNYNAKKVKFLREDTELVLIAFQYDAKGNPSLAKQSFKPDYYLKKFYKKKSNRKKRPVIKIKTKFRKIDPDRLEEILTDLNV